MIIIIECKQHMRTCLLFVCVWCLKDKFKQQKIRKKKINNMVKFAYLYNCDRHLYNGENLYELQSNKFLNDSLVFIFQMFQNETKYILETILLYNVHGDSFYVSWLDILKKGDYVFFRSRLC